jgi:hypothetical protein
MPARSVTLPAQLWRIGRYPDPFAWVPWEYTGRGRFDDPLSQFRVLYTAEQRLACFVETLAPYRPDLDWLAEVRRLRALTQQISRWAYEQGYQALAYTSRFGAEFDCWVLFGGENAPSPPSFTPLRIAVIERDNPDLAEAARLLGLTL